MIACRTMPQHTASRAAALHGQCGPVLAQGCCYWQRRYVLVALHLGITASAVHHDEVEEVEELVSDSLQDDASAYAE